MNLHIVKTGDKSLTVFNSTINEHYHSIYGAIEESKHVFIKSGFNFFSEKQLNILEIGFGTGLNLILTYEESVFSKVKVYYDAVELYPLDIEIVKKLNYSENIKIFHNIHKLPWNEENQICEYFTFCKFHDDFVTFKLNKRYDLVYFDAFSPEKQSELWSKEIFEKIYNNMNFGGILVTYSSKGIVKRALRDSGFYVNRLKGPSGKRHILRAIKK